MVKPQKSILFSGLIGVWKALNPNNITVFSNACVKAAGQTLFDLSLIADIIKLVKNRFTHVTVALCQEISP